MRRAVVAAVVVAALAIVCVVDPSVGDVPPAPLPTPAVTLSSSKSPATVRDTVTFTATVSGEAGVATGTVSFMDFERVHCRDVPLSGGRATCSVSLPTGDRSFLATYSGDPAYRANSSPYLQQFIDGDPARVSLSTSPNPSVHGQPVTLVARVTAQVAGAPAPTGYVSFAVAGGGRVCPSTGYDLQAGVASCTLQLPVGSHLVTATYAGDRWFARSTSPAATQAVGQAPTRVIMTTSSNPSVGGQGITLVATVEALVPGFDSSWRIEGVVRFDAGYPSGECRIWHSGAAVCSITPPAGTFSMRATFEGSDGFASSTSAALIQTVRPGTTTVELLSVLPSPSPFDVPVTFVARVSPVAPSGSTPTGTLSFTGLPLPCTDVPLVDGRATCTGSPGRDTYAVGAAYSGDGRYLAAAAPPLNHVVGPADTWVWLSAWPVAPAGAPQTLTATVRPRVAATGTPTGTVRISDGPTLLCEAPLSGDRASCDVILAPGSHALTAVYSGDATFGTKASSAVGVHVNGLAATVAAGSSPSPSVSGQAVTLRATVAPQSPGDGQPSGTVSFTSAGAVLCTAVPSATGEATCTASLGAGSHTIVAGYRGDSAFAPAASAPFVHIVEKAAATATLTSSANPAPAGQPVTLIATVAAQPPGAAAPAGTVTFTAGDAVLCVDVPLVGASASCRTSLPAGTRDVSASYSGSSQLLPATSAALAQAVVGVGNGLVAVTPSRLLDTRTGAGGPAVPLAARTTRELVVRGGATGVPDNASAVVLNVTVTGSAAAGYLTVYPSGVSQPLSSNLNFATGQTIPNLVMSGIGTGGRISIFSSAGNAHVIADVVGYHLPAGGAAFTPLNPSRLLDTRVGTGGPAAPLGPAATRDLLVRGGATGVPDDVTAVVLNTTAVAPTAPGYLSVYPAGGARPNASNLNFVTGQTIPNLVVVGVGASGRVSIFNASGSVHVLADVVGYYRPATGSSFTAVTPSRLVDTRTGTGGSASPIDAGASRAVLARGGASGVPDGATAVVLNVTVAFPTAGSYLTAHPSDTPRPNASNLNFGPGQFISNLVVVGIGDDGTISLFNAAGSVHVVADLVGYMGGAPS